MYTLGDNFVWPETCTNTWNFIYGLNGLHSHICNLGHIWCRIVELTYTKMVPKFLVFVLSLRKVHLYWSPKCPLLFKIGVNALFVSTFWDHFYFSPYIFILPLLVPKSISACHISPCRHPTNKKIWHSWHTIKIIIKKLFWH